MAEWALNMEEVYQPSAAEIDAARIAACQLARLECAGDAVSIGPEQGAISLPAGVFRALVRLVAETGKGNAVAVVPMDAEFTTQQAADLLNMSRPHLVKLLARGELPYRMVGTHRKLPVRDVLAYRASRAAARPAEGRK